MIIERLLSFIAAEIQALNYVEVYGGVVRTHRQKEFEDSDLNVSVYKKFPISCGAVGDVPTGQRVQRFRDLIPNDVYKSMLYWEIKKGMQDTGGFAPTTRTGTNEQVRVLKGSARLVGWLNLKKLGVTACNSAADAIFPLLPILNQTIKYPIIPIENAQVRFRLIGEAVRDVAIFSKYTYDPSQYTFFYPYDYFALDVSIELIQPLGCVPDFPISTEIECNDFTVIAT